MRTQFIFCSLFFFFVPRLNYCSTDKGTMEFLKKTNNNYYCLMREGLQSFHCQVKADEFENYKNESFKKYGPKDKRTQVIQKMNLELNYPVKGTIVISPVSLSKTGDDDFDSKTEKIINDIKNNLIMVLSPWTGMVFQPVFAKDDFNRFDLRVQKVKEMYRVFSDGDEPVTQFMDRKFKIYDVEANETAKIPSFKPDFSGNPKGFLLSGGEVDLPKWGLKEFFKISYLPIGGYLMPSKIYFEIGKNDDSTTKNKQTFIFSDYKFNENLKDKWTSKP